MLRAGTASEVGYQLGPYFARITRDPPHIRRSQALRAELFGVSGSSDDTRFDAASKHVLIEDAATKTLLGCLRIAPYQGAGLGQSYAAQFYALNGLMDAGIGALEIGRFCVRDATLHPDVLRFALGIIAREVVASRTRFLFGCTSFSGTDPEKYAAGFAYLAQRHGVSKSRGPSVHDKTAAVRLSDVAPKDWSVPEALGQLPGLLRTYLGLGGWTSDHAVIDRELNTMHVFTGVDIGTIPAVRQKTLLKLARRMVFFAPLPT